MTAPRRLAVRESFGWDDFTWAWFTRPTRLALVIVLVAGLGYLGMSDSFRVCESEVVVLDDGARFEKTEVCRPPAVTDAAVIAPAVFIALLLLPDFKVAFGGFSLERRVRQNEDDVKGLRSDLVNVASARASANAVFNVGTSGLPPGASVKELQTWSAELVQAEMKLTVEQLVDRISSSSELRADLRDVTPGRIDLKVYLHQHDGALRARHQYRKVAPEPSPFSVLAPGSGLVGYVSRQQVFAGVIGTREVVDPTDRFGMTVQQRSALDEALAAGVLPSVIAASPIWHPDTGVVIGALSCDLDWPGVGEHVHPDDKAGIMSAIQTPLLQAAANLAAIIVRLDPVR